MKSKIKKVLGMVMILACVLALLAGCSVSDVYEKDGKLIVTQRIIDHYEADLATAVEKIMGSEDTYTLEETDKYAPEKVSGDSKDEDYLVKGEGADTAGDILLRIRRMVNESYADSLLINLENANDKADQKLYQAAQVALVMCVTGDKDVDAISKFIEELKTSEECSDTLHWKYYNENWKFFYNDGEGEKGFWGMMLDEDEAPEAE